MGGRAARSPGPQVVDATLLLRVAKEVFVPHLRSRPAVDTAAACAPTLLEGAKALDLIAHVLAAVTRANLRDVHDVAVLECVTQYTRFLIKKLPIFPLNFLAAPLISSH